MNHNYTAPELVRMELLQYDNPEGLHPVEEAWRSLARKLMFNLRSTQELLAKHHTEYPRHHDVSKCPFCIEAEYKPIVLPKPFGV